MMMMMMIKKLTYVIIILSLPTNQLTRYTTICPLAFIILCSAVKEIFEDFKRHKEDWAVNRTEAEVLSRTPLPNANGSRVVRRHWKDIAVGDLILLRQDNFFPADCVLLSSNEPSGKWKFGGVYLTFLVQNLV